MTRRTMRLLCCLLLAAACLSGAAQAETKQVFAHLFTVPTDLPGGGDAAAKLPALEAWLSESYGGYTRLGAGDGGWKNEQGQLETQGNIIYLVTASRDFSKDIAARLAADFGERMPYVLVFPADRFVK
ncbi:hypothetical protein [Solidesulfovibrio sp.]|uniref:hypothetical protein n=1 Tax=Solidesulfovibrio sp. TaxID=2910990 RepID=UPI000ECF872C|nr:hypothetical protein [Solidesulfovibrio sp.]MEA5087504.1 hypothetical protein [Solidesulfovibrio sp.]HCR14312.1 hypothetical protein [Desulfovibrio sp.]HML62054.1 hypothetical protein [Solidesulfovibrio sp.]